MAGRIAGNGQLKLVDSLNQLNDRYANSIAGFSNRLAEDQFQRDARGYQLQAQTQNWLDSSKFTREFGANQAQSEGEFRRGMISASTLPRQEQERGLEQMAVSNRFATGQANNQYANQRDFQDRQNFAELTSALALRGGGGGGGAGGGGYGSGSGGYGLDAIGKTIPSQRDMWEAQEQRNLLGDQLGNQRWLAKFGAATNPSSTRFWG
ncbi:hypothetical protein K9N68_37230 (plasmid) [Kovacikia minuta CCNUW1]|uniref:hypothetical protein n=1 Tax=Kovacikia minuta TaxID=2931930 RepID=UPI001CC9B5B4|nr:hypothetical protein [Kovacikia minuta]UBF29856.1 hypothetical protein K9N68_37230 [Kovacikia minuta CCNUW1]